MTVAGYLITAGLSIGLVLLVVQGWCDARGARLRLSTLWLIAALAGVLVATTGRIFPGGPFLSVHGDVVPVVACVALLILGTMGFRVIAPDRRLILAFAMLASLGLTGIVVANVLAFWNDPFARGALFAW